jgi:hypothetical protein
MQPDLMRKIFRKHRLHPQYIWKSADIFTRVRHFSSCFTVSSVLSHLCVYFSMNFFFLSSSHCTSIAEDEVKGIVAP